MTDPSQTQVASINDDEIDLRELFGALWRGKTEPYVSINPTSPKASLVLALSVVLGVFFGAALVLIRKALKK